jgi:hypothetical protein
LIRGFVLNKFRGDASLIGSGTANAAGPDRHFHGRDACRCGGSTVCQRKMACLMTAVWLRANVQPNRGGHRLSTHQQSGRISAAQEYSWFAAAVGAESQGTGGTGTHRLDHSAGVQGTPVADLEWLRAQGLDAAVAAACGAGRGGVGGVWWLADAGGGADRHRMGIDGNAPGLGLLPLVTVFAKDKTVSGIRRRAL